MVVVYILGMGCREHRVITSVAFCPRDQNVRRFQRVYICYTVGIIIIVSIAKVDKNPKIKLINKLCALLLWVRRF